MKRSPALLSICTTVWASCIYDDMLIDSCFHFITQTCVFEVMKYNPYSTLCDAERVDGRGGGMGRVGWGGHLSVPGNQ